MNVTEVRESEWRKDDGTVVKVSNVTFDDGREIAGFDLPPGIEEGKPLPDGWEIATAKSGKPYIKARKPGGGGGFGGGKSSWYNSEEGVRFTQERTDKRCSLMQAVALLVADSGAGIDDVTMTADIFYAWLRKTSASDNKGGTVMVVDALGEGPQVRGKAPVRTEDGEGVGGALGKASPAPSACDHKAKTNLRPDGVELPLGRIRCEDCGKSWKVEA